jgi:hypothetical protein
MTTADKYPQSETIHVTLSLVETLMSGTNIFVLGANGTDPTVVEYENRAGFDCLVMPGVPVGPIKFDPLQDVPVAHTLEHTTFEFRDLEGFKYSVRMDRIYEMPSTSPDASYSIHTNDFREMLSALELTCDIYQEMFRKYSRLYRLEPSGQRALEVMLNKPDMTQDDFAVAWGFLYLRNAEQPYVDPMLKRLLLTMGGEGAREILQMARTNLGLVQALQTEEPYETELNIALAAADEICIDGLLAKAYPSRRSGEVIFGCEDVDGATHTLYVDAGQKLMLSDGRGFFKDDTGEEHELILCRASRVTRSEIEQLSKGLAGALHPTKDQQVRFAIDHIDFSASPETPRKP